MAPPLNHVKHVTAYHRIVGEFVASFKGPEERSLLIAADAGGGDPRIKILFQVVMAGHLMPFAAFLMEPEPGAATLLVTSGMGENIAVTVQGRDRFPINVRYLRDYRDDLEALRQMLVMTPEGAQIPVGEVAEITLSPGPSMVRDEDGQLTAYVFVDLTTSDYGVM